jgi:AraC-like DNA-binding protein
MRKTIIKIRCLLSKSVIQCSCMGERSTKEAAEPGESGAESGYKSSSLLARLIHLAACVEPEHSDARILTLRQWLTLGIEQQVEDLRACLGDSNHSLPDILASETLRGLVPPCAMEAERLWFEHGIELVIAIVRGEDQLDRTPDPRIFRILRTIYDDFREDLTVKGLSAELGRSPDHLTRRLQQYTGIGVGRYLKLLRIHGAVRMLSNPLIAIHDIAVALSYSAPGNFARWFERELGTSPAEFRMKTVAFMSETHAAYSPLFRRN